ncbi:MAG: RDD family protein [Candidatus Lokiarchaeia archaeon]
MSLKFCPKCGYKLEPDATFCQGCGVDLRTRMAISGNISEKQPMSAGIIKNEGVEYADLLPRLIALLIDGIIIGLISSSLSWAVFVPWIPFNIFDPFGGMWFISFPFNWLIGFLYSWLLETYNNGQTVGKIALNIRTVDEKTLTSAAPGNYAINNLLKPSGLIILDFIIGVMKNSGDPKNRFRIMQNVSETVVITAK